MNLIQLQYKIDCRYASRMVWGYAIDSGLPVRLTVRQMSGGQWTVDHYDTGRSVGTAAKTRDEAILRGVELVRASIANGDYRKAILQVNRECKS